MIAGSFAPALAQSAPHQPGPVYPLGHFNIDRNGIYPCALDDPNTTNRTCLNAIYQEHLKMNDVMAAAEAAGKSQDLSTRNAAFAIRQRIADLQTILDKVAQRPFVHTPYFSHEAYTR